MWIFTKYGFYSAVCARQGDGSHGQPVDTNRIMVRARIRKHLETLLDQFSDLLDGIHRTQAVSCFLSQPKRRSQALGELGSGELSRQITWEQGKKIRRAVEDPTLKHLD